LRFRTHFCHLISGDETEVYQDVDEIIVFFSHGALGTKHVLREELQNRVLS